MCVCERERERETEKERGSRRGGGVEKTQRENDLESIHEKAITF